MQFVLANYSHKESSFYIFEEIYTKRKYLVLNTQFKKVIPRKVIFMIKNKLPINRSIMKRIVTKANLIEKKFEDYQVWKKIEKNDKHLSKELLSKEVVFNSYCYEWSNENWLTELQIEVIEEILKEPEKKLSIRIQIEKEMIENGLEELKSLIDHLKTFGRTYNRGGGIYEVHLEEKISQKAILDSCQRSSSLKLQIQYP